MAHVRSLFLREGASSVLSPDRQTARLRSEAHRAPVTKHQMHTRYRRRFTRLALLVALACAGLLLLAAHHRVATTSAGHVSHPRTAAIPLAFEQNDGQHDAAIRYCARGPGYAVAILDNGVALTVRNAGARPSRVAMQFGNGVTPPTGEAPLAGRANYLLGRDATDWRTNIPTFGRVQYKDAFEGIDLVFYGQDHQLEYDVVVAPGADPRAARITFDGAESLRVDRDGSLRLAVNGRELRYSQPIAYQETGGTQTSVAARYELEGRTVSFEVGEYDRSHTLVIDPTLIFSTFLGGSSYDQINDVAVDLAGNIYVTGSTSSDDFPATSGTYRSTSGTGYVFVTKFSPGGRSLVYSTYIGPSVDGEPGSWPDGIAVDPRGNAYVTGTTNSARFPVTAGAYQTTFRGGSPEDEESCGGCDVFVLKLNAAGNALLYSTFLGGSNNENSWGGDIAVDSSGSAYVAGDTSSSDFPTTSSTLGRASGGGFLARFNAAGTGLIFSTFLSTSSAQGIAVDDRGDAFVTGQAWVDLPVTPDAAQPLRGGDIDAYVLRLTSSGALKYGTYVGGEGWDVGRAIAIDANGSAYVTGSVIGGPFPTTDGAYRSCADVRSGDAFVTQVSPGGTYFPFSTCLGGSDTDQGLGIDVDLRGNVTVVGFTRSSDFPRTNEGGPGFAGGGSDGFMTTLRSDGEAVLYSGFLGGSDYERVQAVRVDNAARQTVAGYTYSADFPMHRPMFGFHACRVNECVDGFLHQYGNTSVGNRSGDDIVLYAAKATEVHGTWRRVDDPTAAGGGRLEHPEAGAPKITSPFAAPRDYFEMTANVEIGVPYAVWIRGKAAGNSFSNDSVYVQFSDASTADNRPAFPIGSADAIPIVLEECAGCGLRGWAWQDGGYGVKAAGPWIARFTAGTIKVRVQAREDGISLDQIVLAPMPGPYWNGSPGYQKDDTIVLAENPGDPYRNVTPTDVVLYPGIDGPSLHGGWITVPDASAAGGARVVHPDAGAPKITTAFANPVHYFEMTFDVVPGAQYALWVRGRAQNDFWGNDSVFVQFSGSTNDDERMWTIGTTDALEVNLEACSGCGLKGWGWQDTLWGPAPPGGAAISFNSGRQTIRVQTREDGLSIDQIVLSPTTYIDKAPGAAKNDATIVPR
jgi:hypothetical protein